MLIPRLRRKTPEERSGTMTVVEHLEELRRRLILALVSIAVGAVGGWFLYDPVLRLVQEPYCDYLETLPPEVRPTENCVLIFTEPLGGFTVNLKAVVFLGLLLALPFVLFQLWRFVVPGLTQRERRLAVPFIASSTALFLLGALFAYWTLPRALDFLLGFAGPNLVSFLTGDRFLSFVMLVALAFGLAFEFPILLIFLSLAGVLSSAKLRRWRRHAILAIAIFAAVITPSSDPYTMLAMMIPMYLFYEAAIITVRVMKR